MGDEAGFEIKSIGGLIPAGFNLNFSNGFLETEINELGKKLAADTLRTVFSVNDHFPNGYGGADLAAKNKADGLVFGVKIS